ncbi:diguanylate cyclase [Alteromonas sediminis]|uniref:diguanylate cyclase n=1 Tax=Alteromonas sediminis TaxID=2259342 RepID=A0A3N5Y513_9ALTE|nr:diguanylate cyclase [Alteromonas sediminis]RPJ65279.1 diguanylate cyclase [Alteromonas sediminis]
MVQSQTSELFDSRILIVDDNPSEAAALRQGLVDFENVAVFNSGEDALTYCRTHTPHLIILDAKMPHIDGWTMCRRIREMGLLTRCPIIFLTSCNKEETEIACWESGGTDFLRKPVSPAALNMRVMSHLTTFWHIEISRRLLHTDPLTGLKNRYFYDKHIKEQLAYANRYEGDLALLVIDVDHFKRYNIAYGNEEGDTCLRKIAHILRKAINREPDCICRFGGEEFVIILPATNLIGAMHVGQKIVSAVSEAKLKHSHAPSGVLSVSVGAASFRSLENDACSLIEKAEKQLTLAKESGRNKVA